MCSYMRPPDRQCGASRSSTPESITEAWRPRCTDLRTRRSAGATVAERAFARAVRSGARAPVRRGPQPRLRRSRGEPRVCPARAGGAHASPAARLGGRGRASRRQVTAGPQRWPACRMLQANAWRQIVRIEAILPPYIPTRRIPFSGPRVRRGVRRQIQSGEGSRRGDRDREDGRGRD